MNKPPVFAEGSDVMNWEYFDEPVFWEKIDDYVIADRHLPDGTRQHMVRGHVEPGRVVANAQIIGQDDAPPISKS